MNDFEAYFHNTVNDCVKETLKIQEDSIKKAIQRYNDSIGNLKDDTSRHNRNVDDNLAKNLDDIKDGHYYEITYALDDISDMLSRRAELDQQHKGLQRERRKIEDAIAAFGTIDEHHNLTIAGKLDAYIRENGKPDKWPSTVLPTGVKDKDYDWKKNGYPVKKKKLESQLSGFQLNPAFHSRFRFCNTALMPLIFVLVLISIALFGISTLPISGIQTPQLFTELADQVFSLPKPVSGLFATLNLIPQIPTIILILLFKLITMISTLIWQLNHTAGIVTLVLLAGIAVIVLLFAVAMVRSQIKADEKDTKEITYPLDNPGATCFRLFLLCLLMVCLTIGASGYLWNSDAYSWLSDTMFRSVFFMRGTSDALRDTIVRILVFAGPALIAFCISFSCVAGIGGRERDRDTNLKEGLKRKAELDFFEDWNKAWFSTIR